METLPARLVSHFELLWAEPSEMAVFTRPESEGRLHCEVVAYFSPAAGEVAKAFDAIPCGRPFFRSTCP